MDVVMGVVARQSSLYMPHAPLLKALRMADVPPLSLVAAQVHRHDPDRFVTALFAPAERREDIMALYAFNLEVARIRESITEPMIGLMKVQWWRDLIERLYEGKGVPQGHPVAEALAAAVDRHQPPRSLFDRLLDARDLDMEPDPVADRAALTAYAEDTGGTVAQLALWMLGDASDRGQGAAAAVGRAWALTGLLRAVPFHASQDRFYLPLDDHDRDALRSGTVEPGVRAVIAAVAADASASVAEARRLHPRPGRQTVAALLPAILAEATLKRLRSVGHDPFAPRMALPNRRPVALLLNALVGRY
jgi:phytoene synthase